MDKYIQPDEWRIIEKGFHPKRNRVSESLFSLGNGQIGCRGNFEEPYSGQTLPGCYLGGIYYPEPTGAEARRIGLPAYYQKMPNATNWIGIHIEFDGEALDLAACELKDFRRVLHMKEGWLERTFRARMHSGKKVEVRVQRFCSLEEKEVGAIRYAIKPLNFSGTLTLTPFLDLNVSNEERREDERFWVEVEAMVKRTHAYIVSETKKTEFQVCTGMKFTISQGGKDYDFNSYRIHREKYVACSVDLPCREGEETVLYKYAANLSSLHHPQEGLLERCKHVVKKAAKKGFDELLKAHKKAWAGKWASSDIVIDGDLEAQQAIRFNIFHLHQAYSGEDTRLSISPKGFTGDRYGGCTFWSAEAYCLPFFQAALPPEKARRLLLYRFGHLPKAIENAGRLGIGEGAALFPMITMNGSECSTDWEIALEEIHRNGAIAYAIYDYVRYTGDEDFLVEYGLEMLIAICRFWARRTHWSERRQKYVIHGVTGPNEYDVNVNNNWYTNYLAAWCLKYTTGIWSKLRESHPEQWKALSQRIKFYEYTETNQWKKIVEHMYLPWDEETGVFPQQDGYFFKHLPTVDVLAPEDRPLYQKWSWDRILRSGFIKRADVLQGLVFFPDDFENGTLQRNFEFYEPRTVHESSLSPGAHALLAARLGKMEKAYDLLLRSARLDLDNYNGDTDKGCHVTSMGGSWMAVVKGVAGLQVDEGALVLRPRQMRKWKSLKFRLLFHTSLLEVSLQGQKVIVENLGNKAVPVRFFGVETVVRPGERWRGHLEKPESSH